MIDKVKIYCKSGDGGKGKISFRREKCVPFGGPDGGDGGKGGDVIFQGTKSINHLLEFRYQSHFFAQNGENGKHKNQHGSNGEHKVIKLPLGTDIYDTDNKIIHSIMDETPLTILKGGRGGIGNGRLATSVNRTPRYSIDHGEGTESWFILKLRLIGDVAFVGLPNAGKSSLLNTLTNAKSMVANYAFTTLRPKVGVSKSNIIFVDLPGIIKDAAIGKGLGNVFLSHSERSKLLIIAVDVNNALNDLATVIGEVNNYGIKKEKIVVCTKIDSCKKSYHQKVVKSIRHMGYTAIGISSKYGANINKLENIVQKILKNNGF